MTVRASARQAARRAVGGLRGTGADVEQGRERHPRRHRTPSPSRPRVARRPAPHRERAVSVERHAKQRMRAQIEALAMQGAPSVASLIELDGKIEFQTQRLTSEVHAERRSLAFTEAAPAVAPTGWRHKAAMISAL